MDRLTTAEISALLGIPRAAIYIHLKTLGIVKPSGKPRKGKTHSKATRDKMSRRAKGLHLYQIGIRRDNTPKLGPKNPNWKGGTSSKRQKDCHPRDIRRAIKQVFIRDGYRCVRCKGLRERSSGAPRLHSHHLNPWKRFPEFRLLIDNMVTLCGPCHWWVHSNVNYSGEFLWKSILEA